MLCVYMCVCMCVSMYVCNYVCVVCVLCVCCVSFFVFTLAILKFKDSMTRNCVVHKPLKLIFYNRLL